MKLIIGPPNSGKSERVISRVAAALTEKRNGVWFIVPSSKAAEVAFNNLKTKLGARANKSLKQPVITFPALYDVILKNAGKTYRWIGAVERERLLRRAIASLAEDGKLTYFAETADRPGLVTALGVFIDELWRSGSDPQGFAALVESGSAKDKDIALIFGRYQNALASAKAIDAECAGLEALRSLESVSSRASIDSLQSDVSLVAADGFDFYTPVQVRLLSLLSANGVEAIATLSYEEGRAVHLWQERTLARFTAVNAELFKCDSSPSSRIELVAANLFQDNAENDTEQSSPQIDEIRIFSAPDRAAEVRAVAREVKRLALNEKFAPDDIAIVSRSLSLYAHHLDRIFAECSIPLAMDCSLSLGDQPIVVALLRLLNLAAKSFSRRATIDCLRMPFFDLSNFGLDEAAINRLDRVSLEYNVTRDRAQWVNAIRAARENKGRRKTELGIDDEESPGQQSELYSSLEKSLGMFFDAVTPEPRATRHDYAESARQLIELLRVKELSPARGSNSLDPVALEAFNSVVDTVEREQEDSPIGQKLRWPIFYSELERALAVTSIERPAIKQSVIAQEAHHLRPRRYRAVFVLGLIEGEFPAKITESAPYTAVDREALRRAGLDFAETMNDPGADVSQFYKAMTRASERLYLTYARTDLAGGELLKSYLIDEVTAVARVKEFRIAQSISRSDTFPDTEIASLEELAAITARTLRGPVPKDRKTIAAIDLLSANLKSWPASLRGAAVELSRLVGAERGSFSGMIRDSRLLSELENAFGPDHYWYVGQINDYGICPFRFFAARALRLASVAEPVEGLLPDRLGIAYHKILEDVYTSAKRKGVDIATESETELRLLVEQCSEHVLEEMAARGTLRKSVLWDFEKREIKKRVMELILKEIEWTTKTPSHPIAFERMFGMKGEPPLVIESDDGDINVCGIIDRIDEREDGCVVIDYKTGRTPIKHNDALDGRNLQLPIYMLATSRVLMRDKQLASAHYLHILSRKKGSEFPHRDNEKLTIEAMMAHAEDRVRDYASRVRQGKFPVKPNNDRCPPSCEFDVMCRIQSIAVSSGDE